MIRAYIVGNTFPGDHLDIAILNVGDAGDPRYILRQHTEGEGDRQYIHTEWERIEEGVSGPGSFRLPYAAAESLLRALTAHFQGGVDDLTMLRKDHDAERARVDKLLGVVCDIAREATASGGTVVREVQR